MKTCSIKGCDKKHEGLGYCKSHYKSFLRHGDPLQVDRNKQKRAQRETAKQKAMPKGSAKPRWAMSTHGECSVEGCDKPIKSRGLCEVHYARKLRTGSVEIKRRRVLELETCLVIDCDNPHHANGYCHNHNLIYRKTGSPYRPQIVRLCGVEGCYNAHLAKGLCSTHYNHWRRTVNEYDLEEDE